MNKVIY